MNVSILMAVRNAAEWLPDCLDSIAAHAPGVPLYIWDGQSSDATTDLLRASPLVTRWESGLDKGIYDALHKTLAWAETPFVYILGADDRLLPGWSEARSRLHDPNTVYYGDVLFRTAQRRHDGPFSRNKLARTNICQQAIFYPRSVFVHHRFHPNYRLQADWELNMALHADPAYRFEYLDLPVCDFNDHSGSSSVGYDSAFNHDYPRLLLKYFDPALFLRYGIPALAAHTLRTLRKKT